MAHCPVGGLQEHDDTGKVFDALADPNKITVVQMAPAVRVAWAEYYHLTPEFASAERMVTALKQMGFDYVFDTNFTADLTIMEEGSEFVDRFTHKERYTWPMFTSCCPGWVRASSRIIPTISPLPRVPSRCSALWPRATLPRRSVWTPSASLWCPSCPASPKKARRPCPPCGPSATIPMWMLC